MKILGRRYDGVLLVRDGDLYVVDMAHRMSAKAPDDYTVGSEWAEVPLAEANTLRWPVECTLARLQPKPFEAFMNLDRTEAARKAWVSRRGGPDDRRKKERRGVNFEVRATGERRGQSDRRVPVA